MTRRGFIGSPAVSPLDGDAAGDLRLARHEDMWIGEHPSEIYAAESGRYRLAIPLRGFCARLTERVET